jgi:hypothetical protein
VLKDQISSLGPGSLRAAIVTAELVFRQLITDMFNKIPSLGRGAIVTAEPFRQITDSILKKIPDPVGRGAIVTAQLFRQITDILKKNLILVSRCAIVAAQLFRQIIDICQKKPDPSRKRVFDRGAFNPPTICTRRCRECNWIYSCRRTKE